MDHKKYDILIVSEDYPGFGGFGTYAYNLYHQIDHTKFRTALLYFSQIENAFKKLSISTENLYSIHIPNFTYSVSMIMNGTFHSQILEAKIIKSLSTYQLDKADLVISISPTALVLVNKFIDTTVHIYRMGHIHQKRLWDANNIWNIDSKNIDDILYRNYMGDRILQKDERILVIPNSPLTEIYIRAIKERLNLRNKIHPNLIGLSYNINIPLDHEKIYDFIFVTSNIMRKEKNFKLIQSIFESCSSQKKVLIGHNSHSYANKFANTEIYDFLPNEKLLEIIAKTKVLLLPSHLDAGPNVVLESILCKTVPLMYFNTGFSSLFNDKYVCKTINKDEWIGKISSILNSYESLVYPEEFANVINKIYQDKIKFNNLITNYLIECCIVRYFHTTSPSADEITLITPETGDHDYFSMETVNKDYLYNIKITEEELSRFQEIG